jgi:magnesium transporter
VAGFAGAFIPIVLERRGVDPAVASSIFVTTFTDVCGFFFLLWLAANLLL